MTVDERPDSLGSFKAFAIAEGILLIVLGLLALVFPVLASVWTVAVVGVLFLIGLYLFVLLRGFAIAYAARDLFGRLLAGSITLTFFLYVFINMAMVSGLVPVIGLPLPLISRGGTSIVTLFIGFGLLMSIQTHDRQKFP